ncbi:MAG: helix-turn-helix transcriptional regulator [Streptosporangiaceae bacterium]
MREILHRVYGGWRLLAGIRGRAGELAVTHIAAGPVEFSDGILPGDLSFKVSGQDVVTIGVVTQGSIEVDRGDAADCYQAGDVFVASFPQADFTCRTRNARMHALSLAAPVLAQVAGAAADGSASPLRFLSQRPASSGGQDQWKLTASFVGDLLASPAVTAGSLVIEAAARLLAATVLAVFPNTVTTHPDHADSHGAWPTTLRRAVAFVDDHPHQDITVADIAGAAAVSVRGIQLVFRRHLDMTPMTYLRQVRLARAHADLLAATPGGGQTVTAIAERWGFPSASRFTARYREAYGVPPSRTLRQP